MNNVDKYIKLVGLTFDGKYRIDQLLGVGGMAAVFRATDLSDGSVVALKLLNEEAANDEEACRRFVNESKAVSMLSHPNIVGIRDVSFNGEYKYIVMEYIDGISLREYMDKRDVLSFSEIVSFTEQILSALDHAHSKGIIHRDIKPQNIMLLKGGYIKVTDFGIAQLPEGSDAATISDSAIGTVYYISPEQGEGKPSDSRADLYSLGVMLYEMATGTLPFDDERPVSVVMMHIHDAPVPPKRLNRSIPRGLEQFILYAMEKDPQNRYQTATDMFVELRKLRRNRFAAVTSPKKLAKIKRSEKNRKQNPASRSFIPIVLGVSFALLFVGLVAGFYVLDNLSIIGIKSESVKVPSVVGATYVGENSVAELGFDSRFSVTVEYVYSSDVPAGVIMSQTPQGNASRRIPCSVTLTVSLGEETVVLDDYTVVEYRQAQTELRARKFAVKVEYVEYTTVPRGLVIYTEPSAGASVPVGSTVTLYVSRRTEDETVTVPSLELKTESEAKKLLEQVGLDWGTVTYTRSPLPVGTIISQSLEAGSDVDPMTSRIELVISRGETGEIAVYPYVVGLTENEAVNILKNHSLTVTVVTVRSDVEVSRVLKQSPETLEEVKASGGNVTLTVSGGSDYRGNPVTVPSVLNYNVENARAVLEHAGLTVGKITYIASALPAGTVVAQSPNGSEVLYTGVDSLYVELTVSLGNEETASGMVPYLGGDDESIRRNTHTPTH